MSGVKGDVEIMKKEIKETEIKKHNKYGGIYVVCLILTVISFVPFIVLMDWYGLIPWSVVYAIAGYFAFERKKPKKKIIFQHIRKSLLLRKEKD